MPKDEVKKSIKTMKDSKTLYKKGVNGSVRVWTISVKDDMLYTEFGKYDSKKLITRSYKATARNVGKSNETTPEQQAIVEMEAKIKHHLETNWVFDIEDIVDERKPMLLQSLNNSEKAFIKYPVAIQQKFDGIRALYDNTEFKTRQGKLIISVPHIVEQLAKLHKNYNLDGELYLEGKSRQQLAKIVSKKIKCENSEVVYMVFDILDSDKTFEERLEMLNKLEKKIKKLNLTHIKVVKTNIFNSLEEVDEFYTDVIDKGGEGVVIRRLDAKYEFGKRTWNVMKRKPKYRYFVSIVSINASNKKTDAVTSISVKSIYNDPKITHKTFKVMIKGSNEFRKSIYSNRDEHVGTQIWITYLDISDAKIPLHAVTEIPLEELQMTSKTVKKTVEKTVKKKTVKKVKVVKKAIESDGDSSDDEQEKSTVSDSDDDQETSSSSLEDEEVYITSEVVESVDVDSEQETESDVDE